MFSPTFLIFVDLISWSLDVHVFAGRLARTCELQVKSIKKYSTVKDFSGGVFDGLVVRGALSHDSMVFMIAQSCQLSEHVV